MTSLRHHGGDRWSVRAYVGHNPLTGQPRRRSISFRANGVRAAEKQARRLGIQLDAERDGLAASGSLAELERLRLDVEAKMAALGLAVDALLKRIDDEPYSRGSSPSGSPGQGGDPEPDEHDR